MHKNPHKEPKQYQKTYFPFYNSLVFLNINEKQIMLFSSFPKKLGIQLLKIIYNSQLLMIAFIAYSTFSASINDPTQQTYSDFTQFSGPNIAAFDMAKP